MSYTIINNQNIFNGKRFINKILVLYLISILTLGTVLPVVHSAPSSFYRLNIEEQASTTVNQPPVFGIPTPENGSGNNPINLTWSIPINDSEGDVFSWIIRCSNGAFQGGNFAGNGTKSILLLHLTYETTYIIWVNATDNGDNWTRKWYTFSTKANLVNNPPVFGTPSPRNGSSGTLLSLSWSLPINDSEGNLFSWVIQCSNGQNNTGSGESNGTKSLSLTGLTYLTNYTVWVNATDSTPGSGLYTRGWFTFSTKGQTNTPPVFGTPSPINSSTGNPLNLNWSISINDPDGNTFSWTIECNNGQRKNGTNATNGTKSLTLSNLTKSTSYKIWVNATDPTGSGLTTRKWFTFTTLTNQPPNLPIIDGPSTGKAGISYAYNFMTLDPDGDDVYYRISWGDESDVTEWIGPYHSGQVMMFSHKFSNTGTMVIKCQAKDTSDLLSNWGQLQVTMPKLNIPSLFFELLERLLERFPNAFPLLRLIIGY